MLFKPKYPRTHIVITVNYTYLCTLWYNKIVIIIIVTILCNLDAYGQLNFNICGDSTIFVVFWDIYIYAYGDQKSTLGVVPQELSTFVFKTVFHWIGNSPNRLGLLLQLKHSLSVNVSVNFWFSCTLYELCFAVCGTGLFVPFGLHDSWLCYHHLL